MLLQGSGEYTLRGLGSHASSDREALDIASFCQDVIIRSAFQLTHPLEEDVLPNPKVVQKDFLVRA